MPGLIKNIRLREVIRPLRVRFATSLGAKEVIRSVIVSVTLRDGSRGLGECPTSSAFEKETVPAIKACLGRCARVLAGVPIEKWEEEIAVLRKENESSPMALSGLETALFRASLASEGLSEHSYWGGKLAQIETDITIPYIPGDPRLFPWIDYAARKGFTTYKIKVGGDPAQDKRFISTVYRLLGERAPDFTVRLDGNQGYTSASFLNMVDYFQKEKYEIELFEQPLPRDDYRGLKEIKKNSPIPVILDETVVTETEMRRAVDMDLCHGVNVKVAKSGIWGSLRIMRIAGEAGLKLMIGCMTETMTGLSAGIYLAAGSGGFDYVDLDGIYFLHHRNRYGTITIKGPRFIVD